VVTDTSIAAATAAVAEHVRALRLARGWSLDELSGRSGVSKGMVVQVEGARTNPSIGTLCRLADAFGVPIARLLEPAPERVVRITPAEAAPVLWRGAYGGSGRLLGGVTHPGVADLWEWRLAPRDTYTSSDHATGTRKLLHVLDGTVTVTVGGTDYTVETGQTIEFHADRAHTYRNAGPVTARMVTVAIMPSHDRHTAASRNGHASPTDGGARR
jgi:transcriptional regulator with XRE-family HTH domain